MVGGKPILYYFYRILTWTCFFFHCPMTGRDNKYILIINITHLPYVSLQLTPFRSIPSHRFALFNLYIFVMPNAIRKIVAQVLRLKLLLWPPKVLQMHFKIGLNKE